MPCNHTRGCNNPQETQTNCGSPERVCIQAQRVFDACISQFSQENQSVPVSFPSPVTTFVSARSGTNSILSGVTITPQAGSGLSRIQYTVTIPIEVYALDANGNTVVGTASVSYNQDILLRVPETALVPAEVQASAKIVGVNGTLSNNVLTIGLCVTIITRIVADVELLIPSYGYPALPNCQEYTEDICSAVFNLPIYPR